MSPASTSLMNVAVWWDRNFIIWMGGKVAVSHFDYKFYLQLSFE